MADLYESREAPAENPLSEREMEVARLLVTGASNAEIARDLIISPHTVKVHLRNIFEKLHVNSRTEASMLLVQRGWVHVPGVNLEGAEEGAQPPVPEPAALTGLPVTARFWQRLYLVAALALSLVLLFAPYVGGLAPASADILSNVGQPVTAPPAVRLEPRWSMRTPLRQPVGRHAMVRVGTQIFVIGGEDSSGAARADTWLFDLETNEWTAGKSLPAPLANLAATTLGQSIYVAGGSQNSAADNAEPLLSDQFYRFDLPDGRWEAVGRLPYPVAGAALVADGESLYLVGGWDGRSMRSEIWRFTPGAGDAGNAWQLVGQLSKGRAFLGAEIVSGEIYVAGGYDGERELDLVEVVTPATGQTRELPALSSPRGGLALVYDGVALYALGGGWTQPLINHERFDFSTNSWSNFPSPIQGEWRNLGATGAEGQVYITGGWAGDYIDSQLEYQSSFRALLPVISND